jgi:collagenase-like PrtC family protease
MTMQISLGPLLYCWSREDTLAFYAEAAGWPVDIVHLGETVCSRRSLLRLPDWMGLAEDLEAAGKVPVLSTQILIESESDLKTLRRLADNGRYLVEANDWGAVRLLAEARTPFVAGPTLNAYNPDTLALLADSGACRWVPPVEMPKAMLAAMPVPPGLETEVYTYGRLPLAYSARSFTARHYNLQKGRLPLPLPRSPGRPGPEHPGGPALSSHQRHPDPVRPGPEPGTPPVGAGQGRGRCPAPIAPVTPDGAGRDPVP